MEKNNICYYTGEDCDDFIVCKVICRYLPIDKNMQRLVDENKKLKNELLQYKSKYEMLDEENDRLLEKIDSLEERMKYVDSDYDEMLARNGCYDWNKKKGE